MFAAAPRLHAIKKSGGTFLNLKKQLKSKYMQLLVLIQEPVEPSLFAADQLIYMAIGIALVIVSSFLISKARTTQ